MNKLKALNPDIRRKIHKLLEDVNQSIDSLYEIATRDEKTGLYNHAFFKSVFEMEFEEARRGKPLSLLIIDIDYFKKINDKYGHFTGDKILRKLAEILTNQTRKSDVVARFGGEEFIILLPGTPILKAHKVAERIRKAVESNKELKKYKVTISGGLTGYKKKDTNKKMKERADKALYKAKEGGRNDIEIL